MVGFDVKEQITIAYGLYINVDDDLFKQLRSFMNNIDANVKYDICVAYKGEQKFYSLFEFLEDLGFDTNEQY